jgi:BirA family biotin operon repressor/biotin-[acetyl-CoA-carboxylase] ligase
MDDACAPKRLHLWEKFLSESAPVLFKVECYKSISSTMDNPPQGAHPYDAVSLVMAESQSGGRGTHGKLWISPPGGFWGTFYVPLFSELPTSNSGTSNTYALWQGVTLTIGQVVLATIESFIPCKKRFQLRVKWPNDILFSDCGLKVAGVLVESRGGWLRCGIGVNLQNETSSVDVAYSLIEYAKQFGADTLWIPTPVEFGGALASNVATLLLDWRKSKDCHAN